MKSEPLKLRERINAIRERILQVMEEGNLSEFEKCLLRRALEHLEKIEEDVRKAVEKVLEEIEKVQNSIENPDFYGEGLFDGLTIAREKIKKEFKEVLKEWS